jgi:hypothetical protein
MRKRAFSPPTLPRPWGNYAHAVRVAGGVTVYVAGQVGWDREGRMTSRELRGQIEQAFANAAALGRQGRLADGEGERLHGRHHVLGLQRGAELSSRSLTSRPAP